MSKDNIIEGPAKELILTLSAWRRLITKAKELEDNNSLVGTVLLYYMGEAWEAAVKELEKGEKSLRKQMKEVKKDDS